MSALSEVCQTKMMANMSPVNHLEPTTPPLSFTAIVIRLLETREGRGKETRVSRAFGSKEPTEQFLKKVLAFPCVGFVRCLYHPYTVWMHKVSKMPW